jgi:hypothetical protein
MYFCVVLCIFSVVLCIFVLFYVFFVFYVFVLLFCVLCIVCVYMCTVLLPPGGYPIAVNKYIISYRIPQYTVTLLVCFSLKNVGLGIV